MRIVPAVLSFCLVPILLAQKASYPSKQRLPSPNGKYLIECIGKPGSEDFHIFLKETATKKRTEIYHFERSLGVIWSPDSSFLALTDIPGSAYGNTFILPIDSPNSILDIDERILKAFPEDDWFMHRYVTASRWVSSKILEVVAEGHTDKTNTFPTEFHMVYQISTTGDLRRISRRQRLPKQKHFSSFTEPCPREP